MLHAGACWAWTVGMGGMQIGTILVCGGSTVAVGSGDETQCPCYVVAT